MKLTLCDNHPDRAAIVTFYVAAYLPGYRPIMFGMGTATKRRFFDLCAECRDAFPFKDVLDSSEEKVEN